MHQDLVKKGYLGLKWPKSYLNRVFYRIVIAIYVPTYPPIFGIKIGKIVVTYPFPIVPQINVSYYLQSSKAETAKN